MSDKKVIELKHVGKTYYMNGGLSQEVLKDINIDIYEGEFVAIMGHSGSGKSTLMNIIGCLDKATSGSYFLDGHEVSKMNDNQLAYLRNKYIGFVFQSFNLLMRRSIVDNVSLPLIYAGKKEKERRQIAMEYIKKMKLDGNENRIPNQLSGGMQQRVAIARALAAEPPLLLADEPTGNLDTATGDKIMELFCDLHSQGKTIVLVTHEFQIASYATRLIRIVDGRKEFDGLVKDYAHNEVGNK